jgi:hypothetical protein
VTAATTAAVAERLLRLCRRRAHSHRRDQRRRCPPCACRRQASCRRR